MIDSKEMMLFVSLIHTDVWKSPGYIVTGSSSRSQGRLPIFDAMLWAFVAIGFLSATAAEAKRREPDYISLSGFYSQYLNAGIKDTTLKHPAPSADMELAIRFLPIVSLIGSASNSIEPDPDDTDTSQYRIRTAGGGLKIDIPGFLFIGADRSDFRKWSKSSPLNLFILGEALSLEMRDVITYQSTYYLAGRYGVGLDIFPFTTYSHFTLRYMYMNYANNGYAVYSFGGGITF